MKRWHVFFLFCSLAFASGYKFGYWDAKYGYETGMAHGKIIRDFFTQENDHE